MAVIEAKIEKVSEIISQYLTIPAYQRPYCWEEKNVRQLFEDIYESFTQGKQAYRIGSVILHKQKEVLNIVDGQQRITTFLLMLKALDENNEKIAKLKFTHVHSETTKHIKKNNVTIRKLTGNLSNKKEFQYYLLDNCEFVEMFLVPTLLRGNANPATPFGTNLQQPLLPRIISGLENTVPMHDLIDITWFRGIVMNVINLAHAFKHYCLALNKFGVLA